MLFLKLGIRRHQVGLLLFYQYPCFVATSLPDFIDSVAGLTMRFLGLMVLGDLNLPSLNTGSEIIFTTVEQQSLTFAAW